jgi:hypothetical protein
MMSKGVSVMMKYVLVALMLLTTPAYAKDWKYINEINGISYYIDTTSYTSNTTIAPLSNPPVDDVSISAFVMMSTPKSKLLVRDTIYLSECLQKNSGVIVISNDDGPTVSTWTGNTSLIEASATDYIGAILCDVAKENYKKN